MDDSSISFLAYGSSSYSWRSMSNGESPYSVK